MENWEPDQIFGKADFPSRKKKANGEESAKAPNQDGKPTPSRPSKNAPGAAGKNPAPTNGKQAPAGMGPNIQRGESKPPNKNTNGPIKSLKSDGVFSSKGWQPEQINTDDANVIRHHPPEEKANPAINKATGRPAGPTSNQSGNQSSNQTSNRGPSETSGSGSAFPAQLLRQAALESPETTIRFLRKWLWEKWPPKDGPTTGVSAIEPHDRIFIVLSTLGAKVVQYLFQVMSPMERAEFNKILKRPPRHSGASVAMVCRAFMDGVRDTYS